MTADNFGECFKCHTMIEDCQVYQCSLCTNALICSKCLAKSPDTNQVPCFNDNCNKINSSMGFIRKPEIEAEILEYIDSFCDTHDGLRQKIWCIECKTKACELCWEQNHEDHLRVKVAKKIVDKSVQS